MEIKYNLLRGLGPQEYSSYLRDVMEESDELAPRAEALLERIKEYEPKIDKELEPVVRFSFSQDKEIPTGIFMPLREADALVREQDQKAFDYNLLQDNENDKRALIVEVSILYAEGDQLKSISETIFIGAGNGGLLGHLQAEVENHLGSDSWRDYMQKSDPEHFGEYMQTLQDTQEHVLPYLQQFCSLEERAPAAAVGAESHEAVATSAGEKALVTKPAKAQTSKTDGRKSERQAPKAGEQKKSIHERLKENKERIIKSQGKDSPQKGVELA